MSNRGTQLAEYFNSVVSNIRSGALDGRNVHVVVVTALKKLVVNLQSNHNRSSLAVVIHE